MTPGSPDPPPVAERWRRSRLRYVLALVAAALILRLLWPLLGEVRTAVNLLRHANPWWLLAAVLIQVAGYACLTALNCGLLRSFPGRISFGRLMALLPALAFIEAAVPTAGASGVVLRARLLGRSGFTAEASTFTLALEVFFEACARGLFGLIGVWYLVQNSQVSPAQVGALALLLLAALAGIGILWRLAQDQARVERTLLSWLTRFGRFGPRLGLPAPSPAALAARAAQFASGWRQLRHRPGWPFLLAAAGHVSLDAASLGACFAAVGQLLPIGTLLTGYSLTLVLSGLAALPGGLALADASLPVIFDRLSVPGGVAIAAALSYRLLAFWLLRLTGLISWQLIDK